MKKILSMMLALVLLFSGIPFDGTITVKAEGETAEKYEIYPTPHSVQYEETMIAWLGSANLVYDPGIDDATKNHLAEVIGEKGIRAEAGNAVSAEVPNILIGIEGSGGAADQWFKDNVTYEASFFEKNDAYILWIKDNTIGILGKDTDAAFCGISSLALIAEQSQSNVSELRMDDYADGQYRGFIEGYYGIPWSTEDRISLMEFGGRFKMNIYIFAPKDDKYHNEKWYELYPDSELEKIRSMVEAGKASKCRFAWAIHPFMHDKIEESNYDASLATVKAKFQQLYDVGVRQFVISADDANSSYAVQANLLRDMSQWLKAKGDTYNLVFVPEAYSKLHGSWGYNLTNYFSNFKDLNDVELMWTGDFICSPVVQSTFDYFSSVAGGKEAFMWMNWPVNDVNSKRLVMGPGEMMQKGLTRFKGIVSNPLQQAEASKTSLFATADYTWNTSAFECFDSWDDGFKYIDEGAPQSMRELCKHLTNPKPGGITSMGESTELEPYVDDFMTAYNGGQDITESGNALMEQLQIIVDAADDFQANGSNAALAVEMKPWVDSIRLQSQATIDFIKTETSLKSGSKNEVWEHYSRAAREYQASKKCMSPILSGGVQTTQAVEAGASQLIPLADALSNGLKERMKEFWNLTESGGSSESGEATLFYNGLGSFYEGDASKITDGDDGTYAWFNANVEANANIGMDLGALYKIDRVRILQGKEPSHGDRFNKGVLEYSVDGINYKEIATYDDSDTIDASLGSQSIVGRYIRLRTPVNTGKWYAIREFSVTTSNPTIAAYTNSDLLKNYQVILESSGAMLKENNCEVTLGKDEYLGIQLDRIREATTITGDYSKEEQLVLEKTTDGIHWETVKNKEEVQGISGLRIRNAGDAAISFTLVSLGFVNSDKDLTFESSVTPQEGFGPENLVDQSLLTAYDPDSSQQGAGQLIYHILPAGVQNKIEIFQDPDVNTDAILSVNTLTKGWIELGSLDQSYKSFDGIYDQGEILDVKIVWSQYPPKIYELVLRGGHIGALDQLIDKASAMDPNLYSKDSCQAFLDELKKARETAEKEGLTDEEAAQAVEKLQKAIDQLKEADCTCAITELVFLDREEALSPAQLSRDVLLEATAKATSCDVYGHGDKPEFTYSLVSGGTTHAVLNQRTLTISASGEATVKVTASLSGKKMEKTAVIKVRSLKEELETSIASADKYQKELYTADSYQMLANAVSDAKEALSSKTLTAQECEQIVAKIQSAITGLKVISCTCSITGFTWNDMKITIPAGGASQKITLKATAALSSCQVKGHSKTIVYQYTLVNPGETKAVLSKDQLTVSASGTVIVRATAIANGVKAEKTANITVIKEKKIQLKKPVISSLSSKTDKNGSYIRIAVGRVKNADSYTVYRKVNKKTTCIGTTKNGVILDRRPAPKASYYTVAGSKDSKYTKSDKSAVKNITLAGNTKRIRTGKSKGRILVQWNQVSKAKGYFVYRSDKKNGTYTKLNSRLLKTNRYEDKKAKKGKNYYYKIVTYGSNKTYSTGLVSGKVKR